MKRTKKIIAFLLALVIGMSVCLSTAAATTDIQTSRPKLNSFSEYRSRIWEEGYPVISTEQFMGFYNTFSSVLSFVTGGGFQPSPTFNLSFDEFVGDACNTIYEDCGLDIVSLLTNLPETKQIAELTVKAFNIDVNTIREEMYDKRDEAAENGNNVMSKVYFFLGAFLGIMDECLIYAEPTDDPDVYRVRLKVTYRNGSTEEMNPGIYINTVTGECSNQDGTGLVGIGFNFNLQEMMVYATIDCWMRGFGFCIFYDIAANSMPLLWHYVTRRFKFDYNGLEWMIQIWKGNYLITNGAEVGVYNRAPEKFGSYYDCATDDQLMEMSLQVYHGEDLLVNQEPQKHWWINGFRMDDRRYVPKSLTMKFSIVMPDEEMLKAFCESIDNHYIGDVTYTVEGLKINVTW